MSEKVSEMILIESLDLLEQGRTPDEILARYPEESAELRPYLETAALLSRLASQPTLAARNQSRDAFLAQAAALRTAAPAPVPFWQRLQRALLPLATLVLVLLLLGAALIPASATALPGDALYGAKRLIENTRLRLTNDPDEIVRLTAQLRQERIREVEALLRAGRSAAVEFEGRIDAVGETSWRVADLEVLLQASTIIEGTPRLGSHARVHGRTADGRLFGEQLIVLNGQQPPVPLPDVTPTPTLEASATPTHTATATPTATTTLTPSPSPTLTETAVVPTATPQPTATDPAPPPGNANDDDNGNANDDDNDNANDDDDGGSNGDGDGSGGDDNDNDGNANDDDDDDGGGDDGNGNDDDDDNGGGDDGNGNDDDDDDGDDDNGNDDDDDDG